MKKMKHKIGNIFAQLGKSALAIGLFLIMQTFCGTLYSMTYLSAYISLGDLYSGFAEPFAVFENDFLLLAVALSDVLTVCVFAILFPLRGERFSETLGIRKISGYGGIVCAALGFGCCIVLSVAIACIPLPQTWLDSYASASESISEASIPVSLFCSVLIAPFAEEVLFRGYIYTRLKRAFPAWCAALLSAALFGAMHGTMLWFLYAALLGILLTFVYERFSSLWASVLVHMFFNLCGEVLADYPNIVLILLSGAYLLLFGFLNLPPKKKERESRNTPPAENKKRKSIFAIQESEDIQNA